MVYLFAANRLPSGSGGSSIEKRFKRSRFLLLELGCLRVRRMVKKIRENQINFRVGAATTAHLSSGVLSALFSSMWLDVLDQALHAFKARRMKAVQRDLVDPSLYLI